MKVTFNYNKFYTSPLTFKGRLPEDYALYKDVIEKYVEEDRSNDYIAKKIGKSTGFVNNVQKEYGIVSKFQKKTEQINEKIAEMYDRGVSEVDIRRITRCSPHRVRTALINTKRIDMNAIIEKKKAERVLGLFDSGNSVSKICARLNEKRDFILKVLAEHRPDYDDRLVYNRELLSAAMRKVSSELNVDVNELFKYFK